MIREGTSEEGSPQGSSDLNLNSAPATQGLKLDNCNYTGLNCGTMLLANHACTPKAVALAAIFLVNPTNRGVFGRLPETQGRVARCFHLIW